MTMLSCHSPSTNSPSTKEEEKKSFFSRLVGCSNIGDIVINGKETSGLVDTGSQITSVSESFYKSLDPVPELGDIKDFDIDLSVQGAAGNNLPYKGYIETQVSVPFLSNRVLDVPILVVSDTDYNLQVPVIIGTNIIDRCKSACASNHVSVEEIPPVWQRGFDSLIDEGIPVKTTNSYSIRIGPNEVKTIHGIARKSGDFDTAITEHVDTSLSGNLNICPRVVSLKSTGTTVRVPVRVCNLSAYAVEIPPKSVFCTLNSVKVVDSWTPASSQKSDEESTNDIDLEQLGVSIDTNNLSPDQFQRVKQVLGSWSTIFSKGSTDLGKVDIVKHGIKLSDNTPFKEPYRRIPPAMYEEVRQHLKEMLEADAIRPSESPYSSNVVLVRKKDGSLRFCIDFRKLNARTIRDAYSLPRIVASLANLKFLSVVCLRRFYSDFNPKCTVYKCSNFSRDIHHSSQL